MLQEGGRLPGSVAIDRGTQPTPPNHGLARLLGILSLLPSSDHLPEPPLTQFNPKPEDRGAGVHSPREPAAQSRGRVAVMAPVLGAVALVLGPQPRPQGTCLSRPPWLQVSGSPVLQRRTVALYLCRAVPRHEKPSPSSSWLRLLIRGTFWP